MTELKITPDAAKKRMRVEGRVAAGEKVAVTLVGFGEMDKATTRLRVLFMNTLVAVAGGGGSAAWEADGEDLAGVLDLNTVEAEQVTRCCDANCLFILDDVSAGVRQLYATAEHEVMKWIKAPGADVPTSLDGYADILAETRADIEAFKTEIGGRLSSYQVELDAALAEYSEAMNTRADQFEAEVRSKTAANAVAITAEEAARKAADAEIVKSLGTVSDKLDGKQDTLTADQLKAVNSGIDEGKVRKIEENAAAVSTLKADIDGKAEKAELASKADLVGGKVPAAQLPSFVDDVLEYDSVSAFPATGEAGRIFVAKDTNLTYRWSGTQYVEISPSLALGETATTAYPGDKGKAIREAVDKASADFRNHRDRTDNPHGVTAQQVGALAAVSVPGLGNKKTVFDLTEFRNGIMLTGLGNLEFTGGEYASLEEMAAAKANKAKTLAGYGITDAATKSELDTLATKVDNANAALEEVA